VVALRYLGVRELCSRFRIDTSFANSIKLELCSRRAFRRHLSVPAEPRCRGAGPLRPMSAQSFDHPIRNPALRSHLLYTDSLAAREV